MAYNIDSIDIVDGALFTTAETVSAFTADIEARGGYLPESWEEIELGEGGVILSIPWYGECSGSSEELLHVFLGLTKGTAALLLCWEGGDSYTGLLVEDGQVDEGEVVQSVQKKGTA